MERLPEPLNKLYQVGHFAAERITEAVVGGAWGNLAETYAARIAFSDSIRQAEKTTPSKIAPVAIVGVGLPEFSKPRAV